MTFVPSLYLYPSQRGRANRLACVLGAAWVPLLGWVLWALTDEPRSDDWPRTLARASLAYPIYYVIHSWLVTLRVWRGKRPALSRPG